MSRGILVALDVDGSLEASHRPGPITEDDIKRLDEAGIIWGILSSRSVARSKEVTDAMGLKPHFIRVCRIYQRAEELRQLKRDFPSYEIYIYVADMLTDRIETWRARWKWVHAKDFRKWLASFAAYTRTGR